MLSRPWLICSRSSLSQFTLLFWIIPSLIPNMLLFFFLLLNLFVYLFRSCSVFAAVWALYGCWERRPLWRDAARTHCSAFSCWGAQALGCLGSVVVAHRLSHSKVCGLFLDQELNPRPLPWQAHSCQLYHQGSPIVFFSVKKIYNKNILFYWPHFQLRLPAISLHIKTW